MKKGLITLGAVVIAAVVAYLALFNQAAAPAVQYTSLAGQQASTDSLKGKVVLVNFWATSCSGCMAEMPKLRATHEKYREQGYETVAVAMSYDPPNYVNTYVNDTKLPFFVTLDSDGSIAKAFGEIQLTPTSILIDKNGKIIKRFVGEPDFNELHQLIEKGLSA